MPINIPEDLPAKRVLEEENIFVMSEDRATHQDIRPLQILILNLMPIKETTETQLLRLLGNTPLQVNAHFLRMESHASKNVSEAHLASFYQTFGEVRANRYDGMIITGAPVEQLDFEDVSYWEEFKEISDWAGESVASTLYICWASQAGLYHHYGVPKHPLPEKMFGVFPHRANERHSKLLRGFDDVFYVPQSRHSEVRRADVEKVPEISILSESEESGVYIAADKDLKRVFVSGHSEYDPQSLKWEYERDAAKGLACPLPKNYFPDNDPSKPPINNWRSHANLLFSNWLNYCVYQETPYDLRKASR